MLKSWYRSVVERTGILEHFPARGGRTLQESPQWVTAPASPVLSLRMAGVVQMPVLAMSYWPRRNLWASMSAPPPPID